MLANTQSSWGRLAKFFYWIIVAMVLVQVPAILPPMDSVSPFGYAL